MKYLLIIILAASTSFAKTIKDGDTEYQCNPVKTCDEKLKSAYVEIARLKKQLKQTTVVTKVETVEKVKEVTKIKKHIVSLITHKTHYSLTTDVTGSGAKIENVQGYTPAITYQYQADNGITPLIGLDVYERVNLILGIGYEF